MISVYRLNADGTVPDYVLDGGYFPFGVDGVPPQDWDLVGVTTAAAPGVPFPDVATLESYLVFIGGESWTNSDGSSADLAELASKVWARQ